MLAEVIVSAKARVEKVELLEKGKYKVWTFAPPVDGKANEKVMELLAKFLGVKSRQCTIERGHTSKHKWIRIENEK